MSSVNKVIVVGSVGREPEVRNTPSGAAVCNVSVATNRSWKDKSSGDRQEETEWHRVVFYDRLAEVAGEFLKKGRLVYVEGRLKTRKWQDKEGRDCYTTEIVAEQMQLLGGARESGQDDGRPPARSDGRSEGEQGGQGQPRQSNAGVRGARPQGGGASRTAARAPAREDALDDIPFVSAADCTWSPGDRKQSRVRVGR